MEKILNRHPSLRPVWKEVPDSKNGFLLWLNFMERRGGALATDDDVDFEMPNKIYEIIYEMTDWDGEAVDHFLTEKASILNEVRRIGLLEHQSAAGISVDRYSFVPASFAKKCMDLLCADARVAAGKGDSERALESLRAALGIARHHAGIEVPSLINETIAVLGQLTVYQTAVRDVIPALDLDPSDLRVWREKLQPVSNERFSQVMRGEFFVGVRGLVIPWVNYDPEKMMEDGLPDKDAFYDALAGLMKFRMNRTDWLNPLGMWQVSHGVWEYEFDSDLSRESRDLIDVYSIGFEVYTKGWTRALSIYRYYNAALAIAAGDEPPLELITGKAFLFDEKTRVLSFPDDPVLEGLQREEDVVVPLAS
ncbi:hypothetical protein JIN77_13115 [Verrucomicrobiaceae bacterium R5-34]|nr:hypothetical protein [Verrucomicrobiaceae bacterium R5-34]